MTLIIGRVCDFYIFFWKLLGFVFAFSILKVYDGHFTHYPGYIINLKKFISFSSWKFSQIASAVIPFPVFSPF